MQDRFEFRCWDKENKRFLHHLSFDLSPKGILILSFAIEGKKYLDVNDTDRYVLMQCTGLKDKSGKLIYEGDVINIWCKNLTKNQISEVKFCKERAAFTFDYFTDYGNIVPCTMEKTEIEVIGNIYENPELLED